MPTTIDEVLWQHHLMRPRVARCFCCCVFVIRPHRQATECARMRPSTQTQTRSSNCVQEPRARRHLKGWLTLGYGANRCAKKRFPRPFAHAQDYVSERHKLVVCIRSCYCWVDSSATVLACTALAQGGTATARLCRRQLLVLCRTPAQTSLNPQQ